MNWYFSYRIANAELTFTTECTAAYSGQTNFRLRAKIGEEVVGYLEYVEFRGEISISNIFVEPHLRRSGIGSSLQYELQRMFPDQEIKHGGMTDDGAALYEKLKKKFVPNEKAISLRKEYAEITQQIASLEAVFDNETATRADKQIAHDKLQSLYDRQWEIHNDPEYSRPDNKMFLDIA